MSDPKIRTIEIGALTRVEGEGALRVSLKDDQVEYVQLSIYEPPRFFEALLCGRPAVEAPDITARICGICPVAYQMTTVHALEQAWNVTITPEIRALRRLLYCGEWIESHGVHMHMLQVPDFFGCQSSIELAKRFPAEVNRGLQLKKIGNRLLEILGGRAVHPVNVRVGGFHKAPSIQVLRSLLTDLRWGRDAAVETTRWVASFDFPDFHHEYEFVALSHPTEYPMNEGRIVSTQDLSIPTSDFEKHFGECQVPHSTALQSVRLPDATSYLVGPLARINLNSNKLSGVARELARDLPVRWPSFNPFQSIVARGLEVVHAYEEAIRIIEDYRGFSAESIACEPKFGEGCWATEAPRGLLYHRFTTDADGKITFAKIVPPTSQNQRQIEVDLAAYLPSVLNDDDTATGLACEKLIRSYDPCISCSTHFLQLKIDRR
jgi:coenzyme F420-reducing hydrogenase alpha subunit